MGHQCCKDIGKKNSIMVTFYTPSTLTASQALPQVHHPLIWSPFRRMFKDVRGWPWSSKFLQAKIHKILGHDMQSQTSVTTRLLLPHTDKVHITYQAAMIQQ